MELTMYQVDAFTSEPFKGNPAAVCLLEQPKDDSWMQAVAYEMNLSETAFLLPENDGYRLRWFTPKTEVKLCGHATLASAHVLYTEKLLPADREARFYTLSGLLTAAYEESTGLIELNFPAALPSACEIPAGLLEALPVKPLFIGRVNDDYLVEVATEEEVRSVAPDYPRLAQIVRGAIVTATAVAKDYDFISRFFAPVEGINEDPVTGSAHCKLAPYWQAKLKKDRFTAYQASERGGYLELLMEGDRVRIGGKAVTILKGKMLV